MSADLNTRAIRRPFASALVAALAAAVTLLVAAPPPMAGAAKAKDRDRDGLSDRYEIKRSRTNPRKKDTDRDRLSDRYEVKRSRTNPRKKDTDRDGLNDGYELKRSKTNPRKKDSDRDGLSDGAELVRGTNPRKRDTDRDGLSDGAELVRGTNPRKRDTDGDGVSDGAELVRGTDPRWPGTLGGSPSPATPPLVPAIKTPPVRAPAPAPAPAPVPAPAVKAPSVRAPSPAPKPAPVPRPAPVVKPPTVRPPSGTTPPGIAMCTLAPQVSGCQKPFPDQAKMKLVFSDEFNYTGAPDSAKWLTYEGPGHANYGLRCPEAFKVAGGSLTITAQMERKRACGVTDPSAPLQPVSGGMRARGDWQWTRVVARVRVDPDPTASTSGVMIMWPKDCGFNPTRACGEMDYWETGLTPGRTPVRAFMHYGYDQNKDAQRPYALTQGDGSDAGTARDPLNGTQWHEVVADWWPELGGLVGLYVDGKPVIGQQDDSNCADGDCNFITDVAKHPTIQLDLFKKAMGGAIRMQVDYLRLYQR